MVKPVKLDAKQAKNKTKLEAVTELANLIGFLDILIQIDLANKNEQKNKSTKDNGYNN